jgi:DOPA 4,5-dioxygenase
MVSRAGFGYARPVMTGIKSYHAHIYFDAGTIDQAQELCLACRDRFDITMGRVHEKPVGPHPDWSCQLKFSPDLFAEVIPWLALHRGGLNVFIHPDTGDGYKDHTEHVMWLGQSRPLDLSGFKTSRKRRE